MIFFWMKCNFDPVRFIFQKTWNIHNPFYCHNVRDWWSQVKKECYCILAKRKTCTNNLFPMRSGTYSSRVNCDFIMIWCTHPGLVVFEVYVVLVAVLTAAGEGYYGNLVNRFCHSKCFCHHLWTKVRHGVPEAKDIFKGGSNWSLQIIYYFFFKISLKVICIHKLPNIS